MNRMYGFRKHSLRLPIALKKKPRQYYQNQNTTVFIDLLMLLLNLFFRTKYNHDIAQILNWRFSIIHCQKQNLTHYLRRLIGAIEVHLSLGGLSRRQLLQMTFISIVNLHRSFQTENLRTSRKFIIKYLKKIIRRDINLFQNSICFVSLLEPVYW